MIFLSEIWSISNSKFASFIHYFFIFHYFFISLVYQLKNLKHFEISSTYLTGNSSKQKRIWSKDEKSSKQKKKR